MSVTEVLKPDPQLFPIGQVVQVYERPVNAPRPFTPTGAALSEPTVASDGTLTVTGLTEGLRYVARATVGGSLHELNFEPVAGGGAGGTVIAGTDGTVGGPEGTPLSPSVANGSAVYYNIWNYGPEGKRSYKLLAGGEAQLRDGSGTLLSAVFSTLGAAQAVYPFVVALTPTVDWCAAEAANRAAHMAGGGTVISPPSAFGYIINNTFVLKEKVNIEDSLGGVFDETLLQVPTFKLAAGANCHMVEGDPEGAAGTGAGRHRQFSRIRQILLDGNREAQKGQWDGFHLDGMMQVEYGDGVSVANVSGTGYRHNNNLSIICTGVLNANKCGQHCFWFSRYSDCMYRMFGFGAMQGSTFLSEGTEAEASLKNKHYGHVGNSNPPSGKLKEAITESQTTGIVLLNEGQSGTHLAPWGGTIIIGTEQLKYTGRTLSGTEETPTGVTRAANGTVAAEHAGETAWHEYALYQDGVTITGSKNSTSVFDLRSDQNWGHNVNIVSGYDCTVIAEVAQAGFFNPVAQDSIVVNGKACNVLGNATYLGVAPASERGAVQIGPEAVGNQIMVRPSQGGTNGGIEWPSPAYVTSTGSLFTGGRGNILPFVEETVTVSNTEEITVPSWARHATVETAIAGGAGGGGGGAAKTAGGVGKQVGGAGGASSVPVTGIYAVTPGEKLKCTIGKGGNGGNGGAANENPGITGTVGELTKIESTAINLFAGTARQGLPGLANSEAEVAGSSPIPSGSTTIPGASGPAQAANGTYGYQGAYRQPPGGDSGFPASATKGGNGGVNESGAAKTGARAAGNSNTGTTTGGEGATGKLPGEGGAGGGGGAPGGAGGKGGNGAAGQIVLTFRSY